MSRYIDRDLRRATDPYSVLGMQVCSLVVLPRGKCHPSLWWIKARSGPTRVSSSREAWLGKAGIMWLTKKLWARSSSNKHSNPTLRCPCRPTWPNQRRAETWPLQVAIPNRRVSPSYPMSTWPKTQRVRRIESTLRILRSTSFKRTPYLVRNPRPSCTSSKMTLRWWSWARKQGRVQKELKSSVRCISNRCSSSSSSPFWATASSPFWLRALRYCRWVSSRLCIWTQWDPHQWATVGQVVWRCKRREKRTRQSYMNSCSTTITWSRASRPAFSTKVTPCCKASPKLTTCLSTR